MVNSGVTGLILVGGQSSRMGQDKAFVEWQGKPLLETAVKKIESITPSFSLSVNRHQYNQLNSSYNCIVDTHLNKGPLGGILSALEALQTDLFVVPIDMPQLTKEVLKAILDKGKSSRSITAYKHVKSNSWEPLPSFWPREAINHVATTILSEDVSLKKLLDTHGTALNITFDQSIVQNINRPEDLC